jgi:hypothetical protein
MNEYSPALFNDNSLTIRLAATNDLIVRAVEEGSLLPEPESLCLKIPKSQSADLRRYSAEVIAGSHRVLNEMRKVGSVYSHPDL